MFAETSCWPIRGESFHRQPMNDPSPADADEWLRRALRTYISGREGTRKADGKQWSQSDWARRAGYSESSLRDFLDGRTRTIGWGNLVGLASADAITLREMLWGERPAADDGLIDRRLLREILVTVMERILQDGIIPFAKGTLDVVSAPTGRRRANCA